MGADLMFEMLSTLVGISPVDENLSYLDEPASRSFFPLNIRIHLW